MSSKRGVNTLARLFDGLPHSAAGPRDALSSPPHGRRGVYVLEEEFTFVCRDEKTVLGPGGYIFLPRGIPHGIRCTGSAPSTMLILAMPGSGFVGMMLEMAEPAKERVLPPVTVPNVEKLTMLCAKYKIDILGLLTK